MNSLQARHELTKKFLFNLSLPVGVPLQSYAKNVAQATPLIGLKGTKELVDSSLGTAVVRNPFVSD